MTKHREQFLVLGDGPYSRALAQTLGARRIQRLRDDRGWQWPRNVATSNCTFIIVAPPRFSPSQIIRWLREAWKCPSFFQARCGIICFNDQQREDLRERDVFGRIDSLGESFANWSRYIAVTPASAGLHHILNRLRELRPLPIQTWTRKAQEASIIPAIITALKGRDKAGLSAILPEAAAQDWDAICPSISGFGDHHEHANLIKRWLGAVTSRVTPNWEEGVSLFGALAFEPCKTISHT